MGRFTWVDNINADPEKGGIDRSPGSVKFNIATRAMFTAQTRRRRGEGARDRST
jgi:hypothetical protein